MMAKTLHSADPQVPDSIPHAVRASARAVAQDRGRALRLATAAFRKARRHRTALVGAWADLQTLIRLIKAWARGDYRAVPWRTVLLVVVALLYFVNPVDAILDPLPGIGYLDDASMIALVVAAIRGDLQRFLRWEEIRDP
jgi:uncharacterized membrane protein YkvA (DUF1232 family)